MRLLVATTLVLATAIAPAVGQINAGQECQPQYKRLPVLAAKLRVKPAVAGDALTLRTCKGEVIGILDLIEALVDRMDRASATPKP